MMRRRRIFLAGAAGILAAAALGTGNAARADARIERVNYKGWAEGYRLSNGTVEAVVVPAVGRVLRYAFVNGDDNRNALWENAAVAGKPGQYTGDWNNIGGDKVWPWPQDDWPRRTARGWPPPPAADQAPYQAEVVAPDTLRLTSTIVAGYGVRVVRDVRLAPTGTSLVITSRFHKVRDGADFPLAVWTITQVPPPDVLLARLVPDNTLPNGYKLMGDAPFKAVTRDVAGYLRIERPADAAVKLGADADLLAALNGDQLLTVRAETRGLPAGAFVPGDRAQVYSNPDNSGLPYVELELTSPLATLKKGESQALTMVWNLRRVTERERTNLTALAERIAQPAP